MIPKPLPAPRLRHALVSLGLGLALLMDPSAAAAQHITPVGTGADALGMGDATTASGVGHSALYLNPAGMAQVRIYQLTLAGSHGAQEGEWTPTISIVDSSTNEFLTAGVGYSAASADALRSDGSLSETSLLASGDRLSHHLRGGVATGYRTQSFGLYLGTSVGWTNLEISESDVRDYVTVDVGTIVALANNIVRIAVVGRNLVPHDAIADLPTQVAMGASVMYANFLSEFDATLHFGSGDRTDDPDPPFEAVYAVGLQYAIDGILPLRLGFTHDATVDEQRISAGLGYYTPQLMANFGYRGNLGDGSDFQIGLDFGFNIP